VQGGVTTGLLNAVVAEDLPGPGTVVSRDELAVRQGRSVGEMITASVKVEHVRDDKPICMLETIVRNADGERASSGPQQPTPCRCSRERLATRRTRQHTNELTAAAPRSRDACVER
jgi:hypothetical protein